MDEIKLEKATILARQILLYFVDFHNAILPIFDKRRIYRVPLKAYWKFRENDKEKFRREMYRLRQQGLIKKYYDGKEIYLELSKKGKEKLKNYINEELKVDLPGKWDRKWRIVIFDIPDRKKRERDVIRQKLERIGFLKLQESVYVFPFDCLNEINLLKGMYFLSPYVQYIVADRIETEVDLIKTFFEQKILTEKNS